jgi:plastocyanin
MNLKRLAMSAGMVAGLLSAGPVVALQDATPAGGPGGMMPLPQGCSVVADGLVNPRYVAVAEDGTLYITEAGAGGDEMVTPPADSASPAAGGEMGEMPSIMRGSSGQVTMVSPDGEQSVIATGLPSYAVGPAEISGVGDLLVDGDSVIMAVGGAGPATAFADPLPYENSVVSLDPATGEMTLLADIGAVERELNPDPYNIDSNLYGLALGADGDYYVNDAGGNATYRVPSGGGEPELVAVHPGIEIPADQAPPGGNPFRGGANEIDPVPTDIVAGADGSLLSGLLSGAPFPAGAAKVVSIAADGTLGEVATGLTMVVGVAVGPDGHLYATQFSTDMLSGDMPAPGNVVRVLEDGTQEVVVDGLMLPNGIAFDQDGNLLVVTGATGPGMPMGQVLSCEGIATMSASPEVVTITMGDVFYSPSTFTIPADTEVTIRLVNDGFATHDISFSGVGIRSEKVRGGETYEMTVNLPAGDYAFGCDIPGHRLAGMTGVLHVQ